MSKTLLILSTHFVDEAIISEYVKMRNTPNVDAILSIDNNAYKCEFKNRVENKIFYGVSVKCFFFDSQLHEEMELPYFFSYGITDFAKVTWYNGDYRFYYVRKFFPDYDYYWQLEYDVFCNGNDYSTFMDKTEKDHSDLLVKSIQIEEKNGHWNWSHDVNWIYKEDQLYRNFFPVVRLSAKATDFLYNRRLEHKEIFEKSLEKKQWIHCEFFVPTELMNNGFSCNSLYDESHISHIPVYLNDERIFTRPDNKLYHPVKSARKEISDLKDQVANLSLLARKIFITSFISFLELSIKKFPRQISPDFTYLIVPIIICEGGGSYYITQVIGNLIYIALHCEGKLSSINIADFAGAASLQGFQATRNSGRLSIFMVLPDKIADVAQVAETMKNLITGTYPILMKNLS